MFGSPESLAITVRTPRDCTGSIGAGVTDGPARADATNRQPAPQLLRSKRGTVYEDFTQGTDGRRSDGGHSGRLASGLRLASSLPPRRHKAPRPGGGITATSFNRSFSTMSLLKSVVAKGTGGVTAILPDTVSSTRYVEFDTPFLVEAMEKAGLPPTDTYVEDADGSDATELAMDEAAVTAGDKVVIMDPLDSGVGAKIESYNAAHGVATVDYDRLTLGGTAQVLRQLQQR